MKLIKYTYILELLDNGNVINKEETETGTLYTIVVNNKVNILTPRQFLKLLVEDKIIECTDDESKLCKIFRRK